MQIATSPEISAPSSNLWLITFQAKIFSLRFFFHFSKFHFLRLLAQWTSTRSWGNELCNPIMYDVKKYFLLFVTKLLPKDFFQCPLVLVFPEGMRCHSQISIFGGFQDLKSSLISPLPTLSQTEESSFIQCLHVKKQLRSFHCSYHPPLFLI